MLALRSLLLLVAFSSALSAATLDEILEGLSARRAALVTERDRAVGAWNAKYAAALDRMHAEASTNGDLDTLLDVRAEQARLKGGERKKELSKPALLKLRASFEKGVFATYGRMVTMELALLREQVAQLEQMKTAYTKQARIEEAVRIRDEAESLKTQIAKWVKLMPPKNPPPTPPPARPPLHYAMLARGAELYFNFDQGPRLITDLSGNRQKADLRDTRYQARGRFHGAVALDGERSHVEIDSGRFEEPGPITVSLWARGDFSKEYARIIHKGDPSGKSLGFGLITAKRGRRVVAEYQSRYRKGEYDVQSRSALKDDTWYHLAMTCDGQSPPRLYINGKDDTGEDPDLYWSSDAKGFAIGRRAGATKQLFAGQVDELLIFKRVLSPAEIAVLYQGP